MTLYCENAAAAEVIFSLTGGREGRIVSYNPPIEIERAEGVVAIGRYTNYHYEFFQVFKTFFARTIINGRIGGGTWFAEKNSKSRYYQMFSIKLGSSYPYPLRFRCVEIDRETNSERFIFDVEYYLPNPYPVWLRSGSIHAIAYPIRALKNAFIISDTTGVLYAQDYHGIPVDYQVNCISCPPGLCAAKGEGGKIVCIDCPRVVGGLNNASRKIHNLYD